MLDIDYFKQYNDHFGHQDGDDCLKMVAQSIKNSFGREGELVARYGGEEFIVVLPNTSLKKAQEKAELIRKNVYNLNLEHPASLLEDKRVTLSVGLGFCVANIKLTTKVLIRAADDGLYQSKGEGRNRVSVVSI
jgi:diguanylate cyclase (GGDEF)-like protein